jgi:hypothetical protein
MPNYVTAVIRLEGPDHEIERFKRENKGEMGPFSFVPGHTPPQGLPTTSTGYSYPPSMQWKVDHWGTKGDCCVLSESWGDDEDGKPHALRYWTAWSPATPYYLHVSKAYPDLTFYHAFLDEGGFEEGMGRQVIRNGRVCAHTTVVDRTPEWEALYNYVGDP